MSLAAFQSALARLVTDARWREQVRTAGPDLSAVLGDGLTDRERRRLRAAAADPGMAVTATLVRSFRLAKILTLLPLTRRLLGDTVLAREMRRFWADQPPRTFYALGEAVAFAEDLLHRRLHNDFIEEVVGFERALLELRRARPGNAAPLPQMVRFRHDPRIVLGALSAGRRPPRRLRQHPCVLRASLAEDGTLEWSAARTGGPGAASSEDPLRMVRYRAAERRRTRMAKSAEARREAPPRTASPPLVVRSTAS